MKLVALGRKLAAYYFHSLAFLLFGAVCAIAGATAFGLGLIAYLDGRGVL